MVWDGGVTVTVREVRPSELRQLGPIEDSGGPPFREWFGDRVVPALVEPAPTGAQRDAQGGVLLVAVEDGAVVGFVHVLWLADDHGLPAAHLEQVSVRLPEHGRRGIGTLLVEAACEEARWAGHASITLCTYRDVPWNGPFYRARGFVEVTGPPAYLAAIRAHEQELGLDEPGPREVLRRVL